MAVNMNNLLANLDRALLHHFSHDIKFHSLVRMASMPAIDFKFSYKKQYISFQINDFILANSNFDKIFEKINKNLKPLYDLKQADDNKDLIKSYMGVE